MIMKCKFKYLEDEDDIILTPRSNVKNTQKERDENFDPYDDYIPSYRGSICVMNPKKKIEQAEYQIRRQEMELDRERLVAAKKVLSAFPNDIIDKILRMAGFYIPTAICWGNYKNKIVQVH